MKYFFKFIYIVLGGIALLIILPVIYFVVLNCVFLGKLDDNKISYLKNNSITIEQRDTVLCEDFSNLFQNDTNSQVFVFGEIHGFSKTQSADLLLFKYLNYRHNVRHYIAEVYKEDAADLSLFLNSSPIDISYLEKVIKSVGNYIPQQMTHDYFNKWVALHKYNQTLPIDKKILVHGILGSKKRDDKKGKSQILHEEFLKIMNDTSVGDLEKSYCFLGQYHGLQDTVYMSNQKVLPFAARLTNEGYNVTSIIHIPLESAMYFPKNDQYPTPPNEVLEFLNADGPITYSKGIKNLRKSTNVNSVMLFKLNSEGSPYNICSDLVGYKSSLKFLFGEILPSSNKVTTDYFQYILLTRGSEAATPYIK